MWCVSNLGIDSGLHPSGSNCNIKLFIVISNGTGICKKPVMDNGKFFLHVSKFFKKSYNLDIYYNL